MSNHPLPKTAKIKNQALGKGIDVNDVYAINVGLKYAVFLITPFFMYNVVRERVSGAKHLQVLIFLCM